MKLIIEDDDGRKKVVPLVLQEITIGRQEKGNIICLTERNVSRYHARLLRMNGSIYVEDLGSANGTRVNGQKVQGRRAIKDGDLIEIGDYNLAIEGSSEEHTPTPTAVNEVTAPIPADAIPAPPLTDTEAITKPISKPAPPPVQPEPPPPLAQAHPAVQAVAQQPSVPPANGARREPTAVIRVADLAGALQAQIPQPIPLHDAPHLICLSTEHAGREFILNKSVIRIGRVQEENEVAIDHRSLSRSHAQLVRGEGGQWACFDLNSSNGMKVNGEQYGVTPIRYGDVLELGHVKLRFVAPQPPASAAGPATPEAESLPDDALAGILPSRRFPLLLALVALGASAVGGLFLVRGTQSTKSSSQSARGQDPNRPPQLVVTGREKPEPEPREVPEPPVITDLPAPAAGNRDEVDVSIVAKAAEGLTGRNPAELLKTERANRKSEQLSQRMAERYLREKLFRDALKEADNLVGKKGDDLRRRINEERQREIDHVYSAARNDIRSGNLEAASSRAAKIEEMQPNDPYVRRLRDDIARVRDERPSSAESDDEGALRRARGGARSDRDMAKRYYLEGFEAMRQNNWEACIQQMNIALRYDVNYPQAHRGAGSCYMKANRIDKGYCHYRRFAELYPNAPDIGRLRTLLSELDANGQGVADCTRLMATP